MLLSAACECVDRELAMLEGAEGFSTPGTLAFEIMARIADVREGLSVEPLWVMERRFFEVQGAQEALEACPLPVELVGIISGFCSKAARPLHP